MVEALHYIYCFPKPQTPNPCHGTKNISSLTMSDALALVRRELGPDAAVLHTREVQQKRLFGLLSGRRMIEVTASRGVNVPSRLSVKEPIDTVPAKIAATTTYARPRATASPASSRFTPAAREASARHAGANCRPAYHGQGTLQAFENRQGRRFAGRTLHALHEADRRGRGRGTGPGIGRAAAARIAGQTRRPRHAPGSDRSDDRNRYQHSRTYRHHARPDAAWQLW